MSGALWAWLACSDPKARAPWPGPTLGQTIEIAPAEGLSGVVHQAAHNNLDVVDHAGKTWFAFRTAPSHFASPDTMLYVMSRTSGADTEPWTLEMSVAMGTDLREPRFLSWDGRLFFYFAVLGDDPGEFTPAGMMMSEHTDSGWTEPTPSYEAGFIPWRARVVPTGPHAGAPWMIGYVGGENLYDQDGEPVQIHLVTTTDGAVWTPVAGDAAVEVGGGSETDYVVLDDGGLLLVQRNEAGDSFGWGSKICRAPADDLGAWDCVADARKFDSPLMFRERGRNWLIARRNVTEDGAYDLGMDELSVQEQALTYALAYWNEPKRCALWEVNADTLVVDWVLDLPSRGDTCFPSILRRGEGRMDVYNYSSPMEGPASSWPDPVWVEGQGGETRIYRTELFF